MKQIINGKSYNTETANKIGHYDNGLGNRDFRNVDESLYVTAKGSFFLAGSGGPMSKYAEPCGNMTGGGSGIDPINKNEALLWCETHDIDSDVIEANFGDMIEEA